MRTTTLSILAVFMTFISTGCGGDTTSSIPSIDEARSTKQRVTAPNVNVSDLDTQVAGNNAFAFDLYQKLRTKASGNVFYSPYSISSALAMVHAGARGATETQSAKAMAYALPQDRLHQVFNKVDLELKSRGQGKKGSDAKPFRLNVVNAIWGQRDYHFEASYLDTLAVNYGAGLRLMDFATQPDPSRLVINRWVEDQTENRIKDLLPPGSIDTLTRLVLTNAIYFNAAWAKPFDAKDTKDGPFTLRDGTTVTTSLMAGSKAASYTDAGDFAAVALPYDGHELSMLLIVPDAGKFDAVEATLSAAVVDATVKQLKSAVVTLTLPKFEFGTRYKLNDHLKALGMTDAFDSGLADFSGMTGNHDLYIGLVQHNAFIKVDEKGTEAAAATAVVMPPIGIPDYKTLTIDRPFIFLIRDHATGTILFVGRVLNPAA